MSSLEGMVAERDRLRMLLARCHTAIKMYLDCGSEEALDDNGDSYPWEKKLVYFKDEEPVIRLYGELEEYFK